MSYTEPFGVELHINDPNQVLHGKAEFLSEVVTSEDRGEREPVEACDGIRGPAVIRCLAPNRRVEIVLYLHRAGSAP